MRTALPSFSQENLAARMATIAEPLSEQKRSDLSLENRKDWLVCWASRSSLSSWGSSLENCPYLSGEPHDNSTDSSVRARTSSQIWARFHQATWYFNGLVDYESVYKRTIDQAIEQMIDIKTTYAEPHPMLVDEYTKKAREQQASNAQGRGESRKSLLNGLFTSKRRDESPELSPVSRMRNREDPIKDHKVPTLITFKLWHSAEMDFEVESRHDLRWERSGNRAAQAFKTLLQRISRMTILLNRAPSRLVLSGVLLCLLGEVHALDDSTEATRNGCWNAFLPYVFTTGLLGTVFQQCRFAGGLPYLMAALSLSWPIVKTDSRSPMPLLYGVYLAHLATTAAYSYASFRDDRDPRRSLFLSVLLCSLASMSILFWSPTGMESLLTFLPPVESLAVFIVAHAPLIASSSRALADWTWTRFCGLARHGFDCLGRGIQSVGELLRRPTGGRNADEESL
ncbi:hypothetical protein PMIN03_012250 [Paraphaeosphaeria minitans]